MPEPAAIRAYFRRSNIGIAAFLQRYEVNNRFWLFEPKWEMRFRYELTVRRPITKILVRCKVNASLREKIFRSNSSCVIWTEIVVIIETTQNTSQRSKHATHHDTTQDDCHNPNPSICI